MTTTDDLLDMSVDDQKDELENLEVNQLQELEEQEERSTALDNIERELGNRKKEDQLEQTAEEVMEDAKEESYDKKDDDSNSDRIMELEAKVDYIISKCKTTSEEGFENYEA